MTRDLEKTLVEKMQDEEFLALDEIVDMGDTAVDPLRKLLAENQDALIRQRAAVALGRIAAPQGAEALRQSLSDPVAPVVISALNALGSMKAEGAEADVQGLLGSADASIRRVAAKTLGNLGDPGAVSALQRVVEREDESSDVVSAAALALRQLSDRAESP
jgi:HEAT repeat protein